MGSLVDSLTSGGYGDTQGMLPMGTSGDGLSGLLGSLGGSSGTSLFGSLGNLFTSGAGVVQGNNLQGLLNDAYGFNSSRPQYANLLNQLMSDPSGMVQKMPGYQFGMDQALQATQRTGASQGLTGSGTEAAAIAQTGQQFASSEFNSLFQMLSQLSGANLNPADYFKGQQSVAQGQQQSGGSMLGDIGSIAATVLPFFL